MIELLGGFPENVVAIAAKGRVTRKDYDDVLIPKVEEVLARHGRIRCYYEVGSDFASFEAGAMWEDLKLGLEHLSRWERVAVVADTDWIRRAVGAFRFLMPGEIRVFPVDQAAQARAWVSAPPGSAPSSP